MAWEFVVGIENALTARGTKEMREMGFRVFELRTHGNTLRIVLCAREFESMLSGGDGGADFARTVAARLKPLGYKYVVLDLEPLEDTWHRE